MKSIIKTDNALAQIKVTVEFNKKDENKDIEKKDFDTFVNIIALSILERTTVLAKDLKITESV